MIRTSRRRSRRVVQGDIIREVDYIEYVAERSGVIEVSRIRFPLVVVLTQDCDLEQEHHSLESKPAGSQKHDKQLLSVLVAPLYNVEHVYAGEHLSELQLQMEPRLGAVSRGSVATFRELLGQNRSARNAFVVREATRDRSGEWLGVVTGSRPTGFSRTLT